MAGLFCIKDIDKVDFEILLQPDDVVVTSMQDFAYPGVREDVIQDIEFIMERNGIDQVYSPSSENLN